MNLSPEWVGFLESRGHHVIHWSDVGDPRAVDSLILSWAREQGAVVFTNDLDFSRLLALTDATGPSVFQVRTKDLLPESIGPDVVAALRDHGEALERGALVVLDPSSLRIRILPLKS